MPIYSEEGWFKVPEVQPELVTEAAASILEIPVQDLLIQPLETTGKRSLIYGCNTGSEQYIVKHSFAKNELVKDRYAGEKFASTDLPIPRVLGLANLKDHSTVAVVERMPGAVLETAQSIMPGTSLNSRLLEVMAQIHTTDIGSVRGLGYYKPNGNGALPSFLNRSTQALVESGIWRYFAKKETSLNHQTIKSVLKAHKDLSSYAIKIHGLYHGDLQLGNFLVEDDDITAVLDWGRGGYGDPAYDLGALHFRYPGTVDSVKYAKSIGLDARNLHERVMYYALGEGLISVGFEGKSGDIEAKHRAEERLKELVKER